VTDAVFTGGITPTAAERLGDFTGDTFKVYTPGTKTQVMGTNSGPGCAVATLNCIPAGLLDTTIANFDNVTNTIGSSIPLPMALSSRRPEAGLRRPLPIPTTENEYLGKYDQNLGDKDHVAATYFFSRTCWATPRAATSRGPSIRTPRNGTNLNLSDVHTFSGTTAIKPGSRSRGQQADASTCPSPVRRRKPRIVRIELCHPGTNALPNLAPSGAFSATTTNAGPFTGSDNYELRDVVSLVKANTASPSAASSRLTRPCFLPTC